jgi:hypothetical protein
MNYAHQSKADKDQNSIFCSLGAEIAAARALALALMEFATHDFI